MGNRVEAVQLEYAADGFHTLFDGDLFLPENTWHQDRARCRAAGIPDDIVYRTKWQIALEQVQRALGNGVRFSWLTFDENYGGKPPFCGVWRRWGGTTWPRFRPTLWSGPKRPK